MLQKSFLVSPISHSLKTNKQTKCVFPHTIRTAKKFQMYDEKSDIWALGCITYEMACLQKTFDGSNLPALVNKIMRGQFAPIRGDYSPLFKQLVRDLLQKDPEFR